MILLGLAFYFGRSETMYWSYPWVYLPICPIEITTRRPLSKRHPVALQSLAEHIKAKRIEQRLTKVELANILESRPVTLWTWERKGKQPAPRLMKNIIKWLGYIPPLGVDENTLSGRLYLYRMVHGLTQQQVANRLKIDRWFITKIENKQEVDDIYIQKVQDFISSVDVSKMYNSKV